MTSSRLTAPVKFTPFVAGCVLLGAAALKAHQLATQVLPATDIFSSRWIRFGLIELEAIIGLALILGIAPRFYRRAAQALFAAFLIFAVYQTIYGARSCSCLGAVQVQPGLMAIVDLVLLVALVLWIPNRQHATARQPGGVSYFQDILPGSRKYAMIVIAAAVLMLPALAGMAGPATPFSLIASPAAIDLGVLNQATNRQFAVDLHNVSRVDVTVARIESSCPCVQGLELPTTIAPDQQKALSVNFDLTKEPEFTGPLAIELKGLTGAGEILFFAKVEAKVIRGD